MFLVLFVYCGTGKEGGEGDAQAGCWTESGCLYMAIHGMFLKFFSLTSFIVHVPLTWFVNFV